MKVSKPTLIFLVVAAIALVYILFFTGPKKAPPTASLAPVAAPIGAPLPSSVPAPSPVAEVIRPALRKMNFSWDRDPFLLPKFPEVKNLRRTKTSLRLVGILEGSNGRFAILDDEIVRKGEIIGGEQLQEIGKDRVVLVRSGTRRVLMLEEALPEGLAKKDDTSGKKIEKVVR